MAEFDYRPGLVFTSPLKGFQYIVQGAEPTFAANGQVISRQKELVAEFGVFGEEYDVEMHDGSIHTSADIRGGYFDLDLQAQQKGWTAEERALVANQLLYNESRNPDYFLYSKQPLPAPWPKYDEQAADAIVLTAETTGWVAEAIAYERENKNRKTLIAKLEELLAQPAEDELTAA